MRYYLLYATAWVRGLFYRWPSRPPIPQGYSSVSCGLNGKGEVRAMWDQGWEPFCFQKTPGYGVSRLFRVRMTAEEIEADRAMADSYYEAMDPNSQPGPDQCPTCGVTTDDGRLCMDCVANERYWRESMTP